MARTFSGNSPKVGLALLILLVAATVSSFAQNSDYRVDKLGVAAGLAYLSAKGDP